MAAANLNECMWCYSVPLASLDVSRLIELSSTDKYYFDHPHRRQSIALSFGHMLDPTILCRSLDATIQRFPKVGSRIVQYEGKLRFHLDTEQTKLRLIIVKQDYLTDIHEWRRLFFYLSDRPDQDHKALLQAYLLRCADERHGCVLIVGFEHCLGDAASYAMFIAAWSDLYREQLQRAPQPSPSTDLPPGVFSDDEVGERLSAAPSAGRPAPRRFHLSAELLASLKNEMRRRSGEASLSVNDILMAQARARPRSTRAQQHSSTATQQQHSTAAQQHSRKAGPRA
jgi:hypothetical protein